MSALYQTNVTLTVLHVKNKLINTRYIKIIPHSIYNFILHQFILFCLLFFMSVILWGQLGNVPFKAILEK
jgi:hypothetical protein